MTEEIKLDCLVIGAGVVGIAIARELALSGREVWLVERESTYGMGTSSRNSEVIHAGVYYPKDSLKARLCVEGKAMLYAYCKEKGIPHKKCGKLIVASNPAQHAVLRDIEHKAKANGVHDLEWLRREELKASYEQLHGNTALFSPSTGIVDSHALMTQLMTDFELAGGQFVPGTELTSPAIVNGHLVFSIRGQSATVSARTCINSAGLSAVELMSSGTPAASVALPGCRFAKGHYFSYQGKTGFESLIYPVPEDGGLGVHLTLDIEGRARFGPDVQWLDPHVREQDLDYSVEPSLRDTFADAIQQYWPGLERERLVPDYSGVRPKLSAPGEPARDFIVHTSFDHGISGLISLFGIESPGLTSSLALAQHVSALAT
jgi:L-2-hydroxyglutarate oxidase LhgO